MPATEESLDRLFSALAGTPLPRELTGAQQKAQLKEQCSWEIRQAKEGVLIEQMARILGLPTSSSKDIPEKALDNLFEALR